MSASGCLTSESEYVAVLRDAHVMYGDKRHLCGRGHLRRGLKPCVPRTAWRAAPSRDPGSSVKIAAKRHRIFLKSWIPDLRAGEPALVRDTSLCTVTYGGKVIY